MLSVVTFVDLILANVKLDILEMEKLAAVCKLFLFLSLCLSSCCCLFCLFHCFFVFFLFCVFFFFFLFLFKRIHIYTINSPKGALVQVSHTKELNMLRTCVLSAILFSLHSYMVNCLGKVMVEYTFVKLLMPMTLPTFW